jgi:hypothetical protein
MIKKMMLLVSALAALIAFAVPAPASADRWADNGVALTEAWHMNQSYEGNFVFNTGPTGKLECPVTITVTAYGPNIGAITSFNSTTAACKGTVAFAGCLVTTDISNISWSINNATTPLVVTKPGGNMTLHYFYASGTCAAKHVTSHLEFASFNLAVEGTNPITKLTISGTATTGVIASGSFTPESTATLGLVN